MREYPHTGKNLNENVEICAGICIITCLSNLLFYRKEEING